MQMNGLIVIAQLVESQLAYYHQLKLDLTGETFWSDLFVPHTGQDQPTKTLKRRNYFWPQNTRAGE